MLTFQELLAQLSSEHERVQNSLDDALSELRACRGRVPRCAEPLCRNCGARGGGQFGPGPVQSEEEGEEDERGEVCETGNTWSQKPTGVTVEAKLIMEVAEEDHGPVLLRGATPKVRLPAMVSAAAQSEAESLHTLHTEQESETWQTYVNRRERHKTHLSLFAVAAPMVTINSADARVGGRKNDRRRTRRAGSFSNLGTPRESESDVVEEEVRVQRRANGSGSTPNSVMYYMADAVPKLFGRGFRPSRWVINPERSAALERWDQVTIFALAYVALVTPVQVSMLESKLDAMLGVNLIVDSIFAIDMVLQFFLMYPVQNKGVSILEHRHQKIVEHYLKTWFAIDIVSTVPVDLIAALSNSEGAQQFKLVKAIRLMRLLKLVRVLKASRVFHRFETRMSFTYGSLALFKFFVILFVITHWLANLWALTLVFVDESEGIPRWVDALTSLEDDVEVKSKDSPAKLYVACLYFTSYTITSVGYGDIGPKNIVERVILTFMLIVSGISWAVVLGQVCGIVANLDKDEQTFRSTMDELNAMMKDRLIPGEMRRQLRSFFLSNKLAQKRARHIHLVSAMSPGLRAEVSWEINRSWMEKVSFLNDFLEEAQLHHDSGITRSAVRPFVLDMSMKMDLVVRAQNEIFGVPHTLYILNRGLVGRISRLLRTGAVWGADFVLSDVRLLEPAESCALTYVELTTLSRSQFFDVVERHSEDFPEIQRRVRRYCCWLAFQRALLLEARRRQALMQEMTKPGANAARPPPQPLVEQLERESTPSDDWPPLTS